MANNDRFSSRRPRCALPASCGATSGVLTFTVTVITDAITTILDVVVEHNVGILETAESRDVGDLAR